MNKRAQAAGMYRYLVKTESDSQALQLAKSKIDGIMIYEETYYGLKFLFGLHAATFKSDV